MAYSNSNAAKFVLFFFSKGNSINTALMVDRPLFITRLSHATSTTQLLYQKYNHFYFLLSVLYFFAPAHISVRRPRSLYLMLHQQLFLFFSLHASTDHR